MKKSPYMGATMEKNRIKRVNFVKRKTNNFKSFTNERNNYYHRRSSRIQNGIT